MRTDDQIKRDVEDELKWDPDVRADEIAVKVNGGVATLTGFVPSYGQKFQAVKDAKRILGVAGVADDIEVRLPGIDQRPDPDVAADAIAALKAQLPYTREQVKLVVRHGWVTLEGEVEWNYQRDRAANAVHRVRGVNGVTNSLQLKNVATPADIKRRIENAFKRSAAIDANHISIEEHGSDLVLSGTVGSWAERREAERAAWGAPGVLHVDNQLVIGV